MTDDTRTTPGAIQAAAPTPTSSRSSSHTEDDSIEDENVAIDALTGEVIHGAAEEEEEEPTSRVSLAVRMQSPRVGAFDFHTDAYGEEQLDVSRDDFEALLNQFEADFNVGGIREGEIVTAKVLRVTDSAVILEFGFKSEGAVPREEFKDAPQPGEEVEVLLESLEDEDGVVVLSKKKADFLRVWEKIKEAYENDRPVKGTLTRKIKGGVTVDLMGVDAFLPGSQIALRRVPNIEDLLGEIYDFKIIKLNKRRRNIVVSRRVILEAEREKKRETLVKELLVGQVREGQVKNITDFGAFIDLGGLDGLLHITDMSWGRVGHPSEVVEIGQRLDVKVLDIDWNRERISLGLKQLLPYPWTDIDKKYPVGSRVRGKVVSITNYGAFVELEKGVEGLVHISEMSWTRNVRHPSKLVSIGEEIEAVVLKVDPDEEKISLGMKQIEEDPWLALPLKYPTGTVLSGTVRNLTSFGAFVEIEPGIDGLVHVSDMSWTKRVEHPSEVVQKGQEVQVMVLDVDAENKRISLGLKQLQDDPWPQISERFAPGVESEGKVARVQDKGVVVDLGDDIEGFVPASHSGVDDAAKLGEYYDAGDPLDLRVLESDATNRRIVLEVTSKPTRKPGKPQTPEGGLEPPEGASTAEVAAETAAVRSGEVAESSASADVQEAAAAVREQGGEEERHSGPLGADKNQS
jgi:small subunit ribosomal protein S1